MTQPVKIGIAGTGWWADEMFLPSLTSQAQVVAFQGDRGMEQYVHKRINAGFRLDDNY